MGNSQSTPSDTTKHVFSSDTPINFSPDLISSLESTPETNSSRARTLDLHIQQRVAEELERIQKGESQKLDAARKRIAEEGEKIEFKEEKGKKSEGTGKGESGGNILDLSNISAKDLLPSSLTGDDSGSEESQRKSQSSQKVATEIEKLKSQLSQRKVLKNLPKDVEKARDDVVSCLRVNDRRPLDCWKEVEVFKRSVKELEDDFVRKLL